MSECYTDNDGCYVCPEQKAQPYVPDTVEKKPILGWNAGANSIDMVDGDLHVVMSPTGPQVGMVIGLKGSRSRQTIPSLVEHGWYFTTLAGQSYVQIMERGATRSAPRVCQTSDVLEIRRVKGRVTYLFNGAVMLVSDERSSGSKIVNACLYASGDTAPGA